MEDILKASLTSRASFISALADLIPGCDAEHIYQSVHWLSQTQLLAPSQTKPVIDLFTTLLADKLAYELHQRDLVVLHHEIVTSDNKNPQSLEVHTAALEAYGNDETSAMASCVGLPIAIAALRVLDTKVKLAGVQGPTDPAMYEHILDVMQIHGFSLKESAKSLQYPIGVAATLKNHWAP